MLSRLSPYANRCLNERCLVLWAAFLLLALGRPSTATAAGPGDGPADPVDCPALALETAAAQPLDIVEVSGLPGAFGDSLYAEVTVPGQDPPDEDALSGVATVARLGPDRADLRVPLHPSGARTGGAVEFYLTDGEAACPPQSFRIEALPAAPGTAGEMMDLLDDLLRAQIAFFRLTPDALRAADPANLFKALLPLRAAQYLIDHPDNPNSLRAMVAGDAPRFALSAKERGALSAIWAKVGLPGRMAARVEALEANGPLPETPAPSTGSSRSQPLRTEDGTSAGGPAAPPMRERPPRTAPALLARSALVHPSPEALDLMMKQALNSEIKTTGDAGEILNMLKTTLDVSAAAFEVTPGGQTIGAPFAIGAAYYNAFSLIHEGLAKTLPRSFTDVSLGVDPENFEEDNPGPGQLTKFTVTAKSKGWSLDAVVANQILSQVGLPKKIAKGPARALAKQMKGQMDGAIAKATAGDARLVKIPSQTFGPTNLVSEGDWNKWLDINIIGEAVGPGGSASGVYTYRPRKVGEATLRVATKWDRFGLGDGQHIVVEKQIGVDPISVHLEPRTQPVAAGQQATVTVEVFKALDPKVELTVESEGGQITSTTPVGSGIYEVTVSVPDPFDEAVVVKATSVADRSHLEQAPERSGTAQLLPSRLSIASPTCVKAGTMQDFSVAGRADREVDWSASAGSISEEGELAVPEMSGTITVTAVSKTNTQIKAKVDVPVRAECLCHFTADVDGAISGHFEGKATVGFDSGEDGRTARATDLTLEGDGFSLKTGVQPALHVGDAGTAQGDTRAVASSSRNAVNTFNENTLWLSGKKFSGSDMQNTFIPQEESDRVTIEARASHVIPWGQLPKSLRDYALRMAGASAPQTPADRTRYEEQVGDVSVKGVVRGQLSQSNLIEGIAEENQQITFRAKFNAQGESFGCDYEGFPEKMEQRMSQIPGDTQMPEEMGQIKKKFEHIQEKMFDGMSEVMKGRVKEQIEQAKEQMEKAKGDQR